ncbi:MAG: hypothetical protein MK179_20335, partial [Pirellulaceae bacterium]|nr:hypothetical protein [Pirellulaceae bacterium]
LLNGISPGTRSDRRQRRLAQSSSGRAKQLAKSAKENAEKSPLPSRGKWNLLSIVWIAVVLDRKKWESAFAKSMVKLIPRFVKHYAKKNAMFFGPIAQAPVLLGRVPRATTLHPSAFDLIVR